MLTLTKGLAALSALALVSGQGAMFGNFQNFATACAITGGVDPCPLGYCCSNVSAQTVVGGNMSAIAGLTVCSPIEFNGIFVNARNTLNNYTFSCLDQTQPKRWSAGLNNCSGYGQQNCLPGGCCSSRNGTLMGWAMTQSNVCLSSVANSGPQMWYGY